MQMPLTGIVSKQPSMDLIQEVQTISLDFWVPCSRAHLYVTNCWTSFTSFLSCFVSPWRSVSGSQQSLPAAPSQTSRLSWPVQRKGPGKHSKMQQVRDVLVPRSETEHAETKIESTAIFRFCKVLQYACSSWKFDVQYLGNALPGSSGMNAASQNIALRFWRNMSCKL